MPLEKAPVGSAGFEKNVKTEIAAGKPQKQAVAIAYEKARGDAAKADALPPLARALAAADSMYAKALDAVHRNDAERDLPGSSTTEGNYGIDAEPISMKDARKLGKEYGERGNSRQRLQEVLKAEGASADIMRAGLEAFDKA